VLILMWKAYCQTDYLNLTEIDRDSFGDFCGHVKEVRETKVRPIRPCIGILLTKLRSGMSHALLSTMFNRCTSRNALTKHFTPYYIRFYHIITSDEIIQNYSRQLAKTLFGGHEDPSILGLDGTYFYIQKSSVSISTRDGKPFRIY
jgi:hypothetical protein